MKPKKWARYSLRTRLILSFLGIIVATAGLVVLLANRIPAKDLPHIFDRLTRADRARSRDTGGSGLGLSITRSLVEAHGGRIWIHSTEDEGSALTFALPLNPGDEQKPGTT